MNAYQINKKNSCNNYNQNLIYKIIDIDSDNDL